MESSITRHVATETPRVMVVDSSKVVRKLIDQILLRDVPGATVLSCGTAEEARAAMREGVVDLITLALRLPDMDGLELARLIREEAPQAFMPIIVVSGDVQDRLIKRDISPDVTDYFDKALGPQALADFIRGYIKAAERAEGTVLYVEDSRVVALATRKMMEKFGLKVIHVVSVEEALDKVREAKANGDFLADLVLTDVYLKGGLTGKELLEHMRGELGYDKGEMPILVMTGDDNASNQTALLKAGANDLVQKPTEERILITKLCFQLKVSKHLRALRKGA
jgi:CheY-like chemotaxis protein